MIKLSVFALVVCQLAVVQLSAQSTESQLTYKSAMRPGLVLPLVYKPEVAEQTILTKLKETGYKPQTKGNIFNKKNKQEGFYVFNGVQLPELANQKLDLYMKVDPMSGEESFNSSISLMVSKGYDNFVSAETDSATFAAAEKFLNGFVEETAGFQLDRQLEEQKALVGDTENKWNKLRAKQDETRNKIAQMQADLENMQKEEQVLMAEVEKQRNTLRDLEAKRSAARQ